MEDLIFSINGKRTSPTRYERKVWQFSIALDEPKNFGSKDSAPSPFEYILEIMQAV